jgi:erythromycin esterase-like protein
MILDTVGLRTTGEIRQAAYPLTGTESDYNALMDLVGNAGFVLIGEASHGTHEFYQQRAEITRRLIREKGFNCVGVEADWPDAYQVNRYVRGVDDIGSALASLEGFKRFPTWMWRNRDVLEFVQWLRQWNDNFSDPLQKIGFYGLDLYSLFTSMDAVVRYLEQVDPEGARRAKERYACFEHFGVEAQSYGYAATLGLSPSCEEEAIRQLVELQKHRAEYANRDGLLGRDEYFYAEQNAKVARDAEEYYRVMFKGRVESWNLRDRHMADTIDALDRHYADQGVPAKMVVWEHNSHLGDASATEMGMGGEQNVGEFVRERHAQESCLIGFTTYTGTVSCASEWDEPVQRKWVRPAMVGSYEALFHDVGLPRFFLPLKERNAATVDLLKPRLERAIGVIYLPQTERMSHYFYARLPDQFDGIIHIDETSAVVPLETTAQWDEGEPPETFPTGM